MYSDYINSFREMSYYDGDLFDVGNVVLQSYQIAVITLLVGEIIY